jgi:2-polyprenyl-6-methoxyphenol hydroxylase-like FAD-dependent oxidoreductase
MPPSTDVLIVGAGPTGLMLACQLARRGIDVLLIDRHAGPARETRALGVQARTMEIYAHLGIVDEALALGKPARGLDLWADGRHTARVPLGEAGASLTPYPFVFILGQDDNERLLGARLAHLGGAVRWQTELVALEQQPGGVRATLRLPGGGIRDVQAAWVAGCDGAKSAVRGLNGIGFPGAPYEHVFFVADVSARGGMVADEVNVFLWREGFHLFFPMRGGEGGDDDHWRIVGIVPAPLRGRDDLAFADVLPSVRQEAGARLQVSACRWFSTYRIHHRAAERFRDRRCFLLGDAAHIHSPVGAQGMNTGLQDAYNLAWKLAAVLRGEAAESLLDSYAAEREPVARRLLATTDRAFRLVVSGHPLAGLLRTRVLARVAAQAMRRDGVQRRAFRFVSQLAIHYRDGPLAQTAGSWPATAPQAGDRFPWLQLAFEAGAAPQGLFERLDDTRWTLLVFGQPAPAARPVCDVFAPVAGAANTRELQRAGVPPRSFFLLRPDGHIGLCGTTFDDESVQRYFAQRGLGARADNRAMPPFAPSP